MLGISGIDIRALGAAAAAAVASFFLARDVFRPLPPGILAPKPLRRGIISFIMQHGYDVIHEEGFAILRRLAAWSNLRPVTYRVFFLQCIAVFHPLDVEYIFSAGAGNFRKGPTYDILGRALGSGLITARNEEVHSRHRRIVSPAFSPAALDIFANDIVRRHTMSMFSHLIGKCNGSSSGATTVCMKQTIHRVVLDIVAEAAFHTENAAETEEINSLYHSIQRHLMSVWHITSVGQLLSPLLRKVDAAKAKMDVFVSRLAAKFKGHDIGSVEGRSAIIDYLLNSDELTMGEIRDHAVTFMFTGLDTSSNTLQWIVALLAEHPTVQKELAEELSSFMARGTCPCIEDLRQCTLLTNVIKEGLRLYGVAAFIGRDAAEDDVLPYSKIVIPKDSYIVVGLIATHRCKALYGPDAELFRPQRWADPLLEGKLGVSGFMPFSIGKRNCIGKDFAMFEMMIILAVLVRNFSIAYAPGQAFPEAQLDIILTPKPFKIQLSLRGE